MKVEINTVYSVFLLAVSWIYELYNHVIDMIHLMHTDSIWGDIGVQRK